jgi:hypothetical protein
MKTKIYVLTANRISLPSLSYFAYKELRLECNVSLQSVFNFHPSCFQEVFSRLNVQRWEEQKGGICVCVCVCVCVGESA